MHQSGLIIYSMEKATAQSRNPCTVGDSSTSRMAKNQRKPLNMTLMDFSGAFVVLAIGLCIAAVVFTAEKVFGGIQKILKI